MTKNKKIAWESWNAKFETEEDDDCYIYSDQEETENDMLDLVPFDMFMPQPRIVHTPIGVYPEDSMLKPSDRWDYLCFLDLRTAIEAQNIIGLMRRK